MPLTPKLTKFTTASPLLASYDFTDLITGGGKVKFYLVQTRTGKIITNQAIYATTIEEYRTTNSAAFVLIGTSNYDSAPFNSAQVIEGNALFEVGTWQRNSAGTGVGRIIFKVQHWDGSSATELGTAFIMDVNSGATVLGVNSGEIVLTRKAFKIGDMIRIAVEFWGQDDSGGEKQIAMGTDPINRDATKILPATTDNITKSSIIIPFNIQQ